MNGQPNSFSSLYMSVSFTQGQFLLLDCKGGKAIVVGLFASSHQNPLNGADSNCLLIRQGFVVSLVSLKQFGDCFMRILGSPDSALSFQLTPFGCQGLELL